MSRATAKSAAPAGTGAASPSAGATSAHVKALLRHFHRQRPIRGGSLLLTIFGDSIAPRGGAVSLGSLIGLAAPFGLTERLVRTTVARLAGDGWLVARKDGRRSEYRLTAGGAQRFAAATRRIYGEIPRSWNGQWTLLILSANGTRRRDAKDELRWLGFGQITPGVFAHPDWSAGPPDDFADALLLKSTTEGADADRQLVKTGWDLGELTRRYRRYVDAFTPLTAAPASSDAAAFVARTLLIHEYRKIHLQDPLLPAALLTDDWIGAAAYDLTKTLYAHVFAAAERYLSTTANTMTGPLPPADASAYTRFGGMRT